MVRIVNAFSYTVALALYGCDLKSKLNQESRKYKLLVPHLLVYVVVLPRTRRWTMAESAYYKVRFFCMFTYIKSYWLATHCIVDLQYM